VWDTVGLILNSRYKDKRTTIITTNYADLPSGAQKEESLGDRIGDRMWSRLSEMCVCVEMNGGDFRQGPKRARFG
jgi:DNA replication protein DnaC